MLQKSAITDQDIQALVDNHGSLSEEERQWIMAAIQSDPVLRVRYKQLQAQKELLQSWWQDTQIDPHQ